MTITAEDLVKREVIYCVSSLVSQLAAGYCDRIDDPTLRETAEQAMTLACSIDDYEEAANEAGWQFIEENNTWNLDGLLFTGTAQDLCDEFNIEPYQREVYEHWIVSNWLADQLAAKGEKVDKDFAGLTVWARTCTGQGIASDSVFEAIVKEMNT